MLLSMTALLILSGCLQSQQRVYEIGFPYSDSHGTFSLLSAELSDSVVIADETVQAPEGYRYLIADMTADTIENWKKISDIRLRENGGEVVRSPDADLTARLNGSDGFSVRAPEKLPVKLVYLIKEEPEYTNDETYMNNNTIFIQFADGMDSGFFHLSSFNESNDALE